MKNNKIKYGFFAIVLFSVLLLSGCTAQSIDGKSLGDDSDVMLDKGDAMVAKDDTMMDESDVMVAKDDVMMEESDVMVDQNDAMISKDDAMMEENEAMMEESDSMMDVTYSGEILAGTTTPYIDFNKEDYDLAIKNGKIVMLYFYANWCPSCKAEQVDIFAAFNELEREDLVGFRVNYRDSDTNDFEKDLAKDHGVTYQHTKVILQDGERVLKVPNSWNKDTYLTELAKIK